MKINKIKEMINNKYFFAGATTVFALIIAWGASGTHDEVAHKSAKIKEAEIIDKTTNSKQLTATKDAPDIKTVVETKNTEEINVTFSIICDTLLDNMDILDSSKHNLVPSDGIIYPTKTVEAKEGESVFDLLLRLSVDNKLHMEFVNTPMYGSAYIEGINNLYEFDAGELSGWMYRVNGEFPNYGCSKYELKDGDIVEWLYTCDLGRDLGRDGEVIFQ
ncbi:hypothetical protein AN641_04055 [Candidatus Epulonipiscioides gigas]|nr:hypothetical protein AN641_04055 [Epulopiscium sp. SCG-C07WGA-EpuloA2]